MPHAPTVAEVLARAKKKRDKLQRKAIRDVEDLIPPILGPAGRAAPHIVRGVVAVENALMDYAIDQLASQAGNIPLPFPHYPPKQQRAFDPDNPITRFLQDLEFPGRSPPPKPVKHLRVRTDPQLINDEIQSTAFTAANKMARKKDGSFKRGWDQRRVAMMAQKKCTKERERLGLCKRKRKRGKSSR